MPAESDDENVGESDASSTRSDGGDGRGGGRGRGRSKNSKVATLQMCPLDLRFSQKKMRSVFMDGRSVQESSEMVRAVRREADEADLYGAPWRLEAPFPPIELLRWRCKLRDENTGRPLTDPTTGEELMEEESWFTLDNRRLCCLQMAAVKLLPERCTVAVVAEMPKGARRMREIRKFRTLDSGKSIMVGSVVDGVPFERWDWRARAKEKAQGGCGRGGRASTSGKAAGHPGKGAGKDSAGKTGEKSRSESKGGGKSKGRGYNGDAAAHGVHSDAGADGESRGSGWKGKGKDWKGGATETGSWAKHAKGAGHGFAEGKGKGYKGGDGGKRSDGDAGRDEGGFKGGGKGRGKARAEGPHLADAPADPEPAGEQAVANGGGRRRHRKRGGAGRSGEGGTGADAV